VTAWGGLNVDAHAQNILFAHVDNKNFYVNLKK